MATTLPASPEDSDVLDTLTFHRSVDRRLVHRWGLSEVFVTDLVPIDETRYAAGAQLPLEHAYYGDHLAENPGYDSMLILESCRQAVTYGTHVHLGAPERTSFYVTGWSMRLDVPTAPERSARPGELGVLADVSDRRIRGGVLRSAVFTLGLRLDGGWLGEVVMRVGCLPTKEYDALRRYQRGTDTPTALDMRSQPRGELVNPTLLGRRNPNNVLVGAARADSDRWAATIPPAFRNSSLFDHAYDHYPGMVLSDAGRQLCQLVDRDVDAQRLVALDATFHKFIEVDAPVEMVAARCEPARLPDPVRPATPPTTFAVSFTQSGEPAAELVFGFATTQAGGSYR